MVTLAAVLKCRGTPLKEEETWAFLAATATTVQDALLSGEGVHGVVVCPDGLALRRCGRVELLPTTADAHALFLPPVEEQHDGERLATPRYPTLHHTHTLPNLATPISCQTSA
ncbi:hypothetical protein O3P69_007289 [Scylla paramamosain]|uniref:KIND domain-containing protein n=1 Tax=Scylla paramamosain TaxID=85552 RepID=A0AAW0V6P9_SCYPA